MVEFYFFYFFLLCQLMILVKKESFVAATQESKAKKTVALLKAISNLQTLMGSMIDRFGLQIIMFLLGLSNPSPTINNVVFIKNYFSFPTFCFYLIAVTYKQTKRIHFFVSTLNEFIMHVPTPLGLLINSTTIFPYISNYRKVCWGHKYCSLIVLFC